MNLETGAEALMAAIGVEIGKLVIKFLKNGKQDKDRKWTIARRKKKVQKK